MLRIPSSWDNVHKLSLVTFFTNFYPYLPVMTLYFQDRGLSLFQIASLTSIIIGAQFLGEIPTGLFADRVGRKTSLLIALLLQFIGELAFLFAHDYWQFVLMQLIAALGFCFMSGCMDALLYDSLPEENRADEMKRARGIIGGWAHLASVVAFFSSGFLAARFRPDRFLLAVAVTAAFVFVGLMVCLTLREPERETSRGERAGLSESSALLTGGVRLLRENASLRRIVLLSLLTNPFGWYLLTYYAPYLRLAGTPGLWFGAAVSAGSLLSAVAERSAFRVEVTLGMKRSALLATMLPGIFYLLLAVVVHPAGSPLLFCLLSGAIHLRNPLFSAYVNGHIESHHRATVLSLLNMIESVYLAFMGLILGRVAEWSVPGCFAAMGGLILLGALTLRIDEKHLD